MENRKVQLAELIETPITGEWGNEITDVNNQHIVKVIRTTNFTNNGEIDYSDITLRDIEYTKCEKKKLKYGDIILEKSGGTDLNPVGRVVFFDKNDPNDVYLTNNFTTTLRVKDNKINSRFLLLFLLYNYKYKGVHKFYNKTTGIQNLQVSNLIKNTYVPLPEIKIQSAIVEILDKIKNMIKKREKQILLFDELVKSRFIEMFGDPIKNEKGWKVSNFGKNFEVSSGGTPSTKISEYWENGNISWIGSNLCQNKRLNENDGKYITELGYENSSAKLYAKGTILIALVGATIGKTALLKFPTATNQNIAGVEVDNNKFSSDFVFFVAQLLYPKFQGIGKNKFKMANLKFIKDLPIIIPPLQLQNEFAEFTTKIDKLKFEAEKSLKEMENLYESLMQKFFKQN